MKKRWFLAILLVLLALAALLTTSCTPTTQRVARAAEPARISAVSVLVAPARTGTISRVYNYSGDLRPKHSVNVLPVAAGRVQSLMVEVGDQIKAGDPIAIVESKTYAAQLKQAEANLELARLSLAKMEEGTRPEQIAAAEAAVRFARSAVNDLLNVNEDERTAAAATLAQAEAALKLAQAEYDKVAWAGQVGMLPQSLKLEQATIAYEVARAAYNMQTHPSDVQLSPLMVQLAQAELALALAKQPYTQTDFELARVKIKQAEAAVELARIQLDETTIRAPFDGIVAELYVSEGSIVGPSTPVALFVSRELEAVIDVEENRIQEVRPGQHAAIKVSAYPDEDFPAVVTSVAPVADPATHTFTVKVTPVDEAGKLRSGMYANLALLVEEKQAALLVPRAAVTLINNKESVYVVQDDIAQLRPVVTGLTDGDNVEILSGLRPGEMVVTAGQSSLNDGMRVRIASEAGQID